MEDGNVGALEDRDLDEYFRKRPGTTNWGTDYEMLFIANLALTLSVREHVADFQISTNVKEFGDFDDVVFQASTTDGHAESFALQLKYRTAEKMITHQQLQTPRGDFGLQRYLHSYSLLENKPHFKFILFTNASIRAPEGFFPITPDQGTKRLQMIAANPNQSNILDLRQNCFQFISEDADVDPVFSNFFHQFIFLANQPNVQRLEFETYRLYQQHFESSYENFQLYIHFIQRWMKLEKQNYLTKYSVPQMIALQILTPDLKLFPHVIENNNDNNKYALIRRLTNQFNIVASKNATYPFLHKCVTSHDIEDEETKLNKILRRYPLIEPSIRNFNEIGDSLVKEKLLWLLGKQPIIICGNARSYSAIKLCQRKQFLVLDDHFQAENFVFPRLSVFWNLSDLSNNPNFLSEILENFDTQEGTLQSLVQLYPEIRDSITLHELIVMAESTVEVFEPLEALPPGHIERNLTKNIIDFDFLAEHVNGTRIIAIGCLGQLENVEDFEILDIEEMLINFDETRITERTIYISKERILPENLEALIALLNKPCHYFEIADGKLEWIYSTASITELQDYQNFSFVTNQNNVNHYKNEVILIAGQPGSGKSTLCRSMKNSLNRNVWKTIITPEFFLKFLKKNADNNENRSNLFLDAISNKYDPLQQIVFKVLRGRKKLILFWDEFDQLVRSCGTVAIGTVKALAQNGVKQYVITRSSETQLLEEQFNALSRSLKPFSPAEREHYVRNQLPNLNRTLLRKVLREIKLNPDSPVVTIPSNLSLLVDRLQRNEEQYLNAIQEFSFLTL